jgi:thioredoxin-related protein
MKVILGFLTALAVALASQDRWYPDFHEGLSVARKNNKIVMLYFYEEACTYCKYMEEVVFIDPKVSDFMSKNFVVVPIDVEDPPENLDRRFRAFGTPHFMFLDPFKNRVILEVLGMQETDEFLNFLKTACRKFERRSC